MPALLSTDQRGAEVRLRGEGQPMLVYFYPRDGTPGCTREACAFRDSWDRYEKAGLRVVGVSTDSVERHRAFAAEHGLQFSLVSDPDHAWSRAFGVGTFAGLAARVSFLISREGKVIKVYRDVDPGVHADEVLKDAEALAVIAPASAP